MQAVVAQLERHVVARRPIDGRLHRRVQYGLVAARQRRVQRLLLRIGDHHLGPSRLESNAAIGVGQRLWWRSRSCSASMPLDMVVACAAAAAALLASRLLVAVVVVGVVGGLVLDVVEEDVGLEVAVDLMMLGLVDHVEGPLAVARPLELAHDLLLVERPDLVREERRVLALDVVLAEMLLAVGLVHDQLDVLLHLADVELEAQEGVGARAHTLVHKHVAALVRLGADLEEAVHQLHNLLRVF